MMSRAWMLGGLGLFACGGGAWGHEDGFAEQLSQGCTNEKECDELVGAARWRARRCGTISRDPEICAEANDHLETAENVAQGKKNQADAQETAEEREKSREGELAKKRLSENCALEQAELERKMTERDKRIEHLEVENKVLREQVKSSEEIVKTLHQDQ